MVKFVQSERVRSCLEIYDRTLLMLAQTLRQAQGDRRTGHVELVETYAQANLKYDFQTPSQCSRSR